MTTTVDLTTVLRYAATLIRVRGHNRDNDSGTKPGPVSVYGALRVSCTHHNLTSGQWEALLGRVNDYSWDTLNDGIKQWERAGRDRDLTVEAADHLDAAATYTR